MILPFLLGVLLNTNHQEEFLIGYKDGKPLVFQASYLGIDSSGNQLFLEQSAAINFKVMQAYAKLDGINLVINYAYRDKQTQKYLYRTSKRLAAKPGYSPHQSGIAVDIDGVVLKKHKTKIYWWLYQNSKKFGFFQTIKHEPWHFEWLKK